MYSRVSKLTALMDLYPETGSNAGFLPRDTAKHHQDCVLEVLKEALDEARIDPRDIDVVCYTKGNGWVICASLLVLPLVSNL